MLRSSLGFHTMTLSLTLTQDEVRHLIRDFMEYGQKTGLIQMYRKNEQGIYIKYSCANNYISYLPRDIKVYFTREYKGIMWQIREEDYFYGSMYVVEAIINPKMLAGIHNYLIAATYGDMNVAIINFNDQSNRISPLLRTFDDYVLRRIDYCVNFQLDELAPECNPDLIMNLIRRGDIPAHYREWTQYDKISHREKSKPGSFYLINRSVNINCYSKYIQLQDRSRKYVENGYLPISQDILDDAKNIIRFEIQCKYHKTYSLSSKAEKSGNGNRDKRKELLSPINCIKVISDYYKKVIGRGDWYSLQEAIRIVESKHFNSQKEKRLVCALQLVNQCRSIAKAKAACQGYELEALKRTLNELSILNINPVTIPKDWNAKHIPNLLRAYFNKHLQASLDLNALGVDPCVPQGYSDYIRIFGCPPI